MPGVKLLQLCKKVHEEASSILYAENTFTFGIEVNWSKLNRMRLHCFPPSLSIWPTTRYHQWVRKLHIGISFTPGLPIDFEPPSFLSSDIKNMRKAYDACWDDLDITYELCEGTTHRLTFTMAWLKFRCLEPISHPNCKLITKDNISPLVRWCLERTLQQRNPAENLHKEQLSALQEAHEIACDSYYSGMRRCITDLAWRLVWGSPFETTPPHIAPGITFGAAPVFVAPGVRRRIYDHKVMYQQINNSITDHTATELLLRDNEMRILAALEMPDEKELLIKDCAELRMYFTLQETAMKIIALSRSLSD
ncbi:uncharacterized protein PV09_07148 [Verruconis gallopava]|uniref:Uncharacterized protein n=1 Tax=Verruconis gallopava TaxID=253628 RepID=A0A0D2A4I7_9PEZI|nr:uncharacterized protein PV09_07148 [Verruconis gallopava]KIW01380.1 hypothetical protein PV09_07148 [Verruconis gallopava]